MTGFFRYAVLLCTVGIALFAVRLHADEALSVSVTPPLFQLTIGPGETWNSALKVVNSNTYDVTYYAQIVDFEAKGEDGTGSFTPLADEVHRGAKESFSLASWITMATTSVRVRAGSSAELPFTVRVPENAEPGGHYGAIMVGTEPGSGKSTGALMKVSSYVTSLLFVRIKGNVIESGRIREFVSSKALYDTPQADFMLRFENTGNTHLKPEGDVTIYNMWGKERGKVLINQSNGNFGNVLPKSIRRFEFSWAGESNPFDIGEYSAVTTLSFGEEGKQSVSAKTYFWVVPVVPVSITLFSLTMFFVLMAWLIRRYIRASLSLEQARLGIVAPNRVAQELPLTLETLVEPIKEGVVDLRKLTSTRRTTPLLAAADTPEGRVAYRNNGLDAAERMRRMTIVEFLNKYRLFAVFLLLVCLGAIVSWHYFDKVLTAHRGFQIKDVTIHEE